MGPHRRWAKHAVVPTLPTGRTFGLVLRVLLGRAARKLSRRGDRLAPRLAQRLAQRLALRLALNWRPESHPEIAPGLVSRLMPELCPESRVVPGSCQGRARVMSRVGSVQSRSEGENGPRLS